MAISSEFCHLPTLLPVSDLCFVPIVPLKPVLETQRHLLLLDEAEHVTLYTLALLARNEDCLVKICSTGAEDGKIESIRILALIFSGKSSD